MADQCLTMFLCIGRSDLLSDGIQESGFSLEFLIHQLFQPLGRYAFFFQPAQTFTCQ